MKSKIFAKKNNLNKMLKKTLLICLFLNSLVSFSQDIVNSVPVALKKNRDVFQTVNNDKKEVTLFVSDKAKVKAILLDEKMKILDSISTERPDTTIYHNMIGYNSSNNNTRLFWSSNDYKDIYSQLYDFSSRKIETQQHTLVLKGEKVLQKFSEKENFYILTIIKKTNSFKFHIFDKDGRYQQKTIDLNNFQFFSQDYSKTTLYNIFQEDLLPFEDPFTLEDINTENPTSITNGAKKRKCYFNNKQLVITLDANTNFTQVITIDLKRFTADQKILKQHAIDSSDSRSLNSNSFFFENKLYQIKSSSQEFYFAIKDLDDNIIKEYYADASKQIEFKNSVIYQEGGDFGGKRILENSSQFIRKINNLNSGLVCYHIGQNTLITFGGVSAVQQSYMPTIESPQFGLAGALASAAVVAIYAIYNPTMENFNSYSKRKVVKIDGLFNKEGNHINGELQPLAFDKIRTFFDNYSDVSSQTLFKMTDSYYLGYYDNTSKEYTIRRFTD